MSIMSEKPRDLHPNEEEYFSNLFGYLLAKSAETEYARTHRTGLLRLRPKVTVTPSDAWAGRYGSAFKGETHKSLAELMELGKQFRKDYSFYREQNGLEVLWDDPDLEKALRAVCLIGEIYSRENL